MRPAERLAPRPARESRPARRPLRLCRQLLAAVCLAATAGAATAAGPNLLVNPNFDTGVAGWTSDGVLTFDPTRDVDGSASSGSALGQAPEGIANVLCQCVDTDATAGQLLEFGGAFWVAPGVDPEASVAFLLNTFEKPGCSGTLINAGGADFPFVPGRWTQAVLLLGLGSEKSVQLCGQVAVASGKPMQANFDGMLLRHTTASDCRQDGTTLCLNGQRFSVKASYQKADGEATPARVVPVTTASGHLWFFSSDNIEVVIKLIDGCQVNRRFWVFASGLTNLKVQITVTDTQTGKQVTYRNPLNQAFPTIQDTSAFATCP
jgi:hypothetical protein